MGTGAGRTHVVASTWGRSARGVAPRHGGHSVGSAQASRAEARRCGPERPDALQVRRRGNKSRTLARRDRTTLIPTRAPSRLFPWRIPHCICITTAGSSTAVQVLQPRSDLHLNLRPDVGTQLTSARRRGGSRQGGACHARLRRGRRVLCCRTRTVAAGGRHEPAARWRGSAQRAGVVPRPHDAERADLLGRQRLDTAAALERRHRLD